MKPEALKPGESADTYAEFDSHKTIRDLKEAIASHGHEVTIYNANENLFENMKKNREQIDFVFNIAEGLRGEFRESVVQTYCEVLNLPYHGPGPLTAALTLNKGRTKEILVANDIPTPKFQVFYTGKERLQVERLTFPLLLKPMLEGSSKGIFNENLVYNELQLQKILQKINSKYQQPVIAEEFLNGREFTVAVIEDSQKPEGENLTVLPIVEITFDHLPPELHPMDSYEAKWIYDTPEFIEKSKVDPVVCPAKISSELRQQIENTAKKTFLVLNCKDWARIDLRMDKESVVNVLEVNALPGLMKDPAENSRLPKAAYAAGWTYEQLIGTVLNSALRRWKKKREL